MRTLAALSLVIGLMTQTGLAQDTIGFPKDVFGNIVLSQQQFGAKLESSIGSYNNEPISKYGRRSLFVRLGRSIGRVDIKTDAGVFPCTGFLISDSHVLTNHHCVPGILENPRAKSKRIEAVQLVLGYIRDGVERGVRRYAVSPTPVEQDKSLDYAILKVTGNPGQLFGKLALSSVQPSDSAPYWIIGHPMGEAQRISREDCQSDAPAVAAGRLRHRCDTLPGNSGSPVIDPALRAAVALHHAGSSRADINYAIPIVRIAQHSRIISRLLASNAAGSSAAARIPAGAPLPAAELDGKWIGEVCSLKTANKDELCRQLVFDIQQNDISARTGVKGQPGYSVFNGRIAETGNVAVDVHGIRVRGEGRGKPYKASLTGLAAAGAIDAAGSYVTGRGITLRLRRNRAALSQRASIEVRGGSPAARREPPSAQHPYDGNWQVLVRSATNCPRRSWRFRINIKQGRVFGGPRMKPGTIDQSGKFRISHSGKRRPELVFQYVGQITGLAGTGELQVLGRRCRGSVELTKISSP